LEKTAEVVPGGIFGLVKEGRYPWYLRSFCRSFPDNSQCRVTLTPELVDPLTLHFENFITQEGIGLEMPLRLHLKNPFLGDKCYIGSASNPVTPAFSTGSKPPFGLEPEVTGELDGTFSEEEGAILIIPKTELVDNAYPTPGAEGCGGPQSPIVDREIDEKQALPSAAGHSRARLDVVLALTAAGNVEESEARP
jgi:hypothetical protein